MAVINRIFNRQELRNFYHILVGTELRKAGTEFSKEVKYTLQNIGYQQALKNAAPALPEAKPTVKHIDPKILSMARTSTGPGSTPPAGGAAGSSAVVPENEIKNSIEKMAQLRPFNRSTLIWCGIGILLATPLGALTPLAMELPFLLLGPIAYLVRRFVTIPHKNNVLYREIADRLETPEGKGELAILIADGKVNAKDLYGTLEKHKLAIHPDIKTEIDNLVLLLTGLKGIKDQVYGNTADDLNQVRIDHQYICSNLNNIPEAKKALATELMGKLSSKAQEIEAKLNQNKAQAEYDKIKAKIDTCPETQASFDELNAAYDYFLGLHQNDRPAEIQSDTDCQRFIDRLFKRRSQISIRIDLDNISKKRYERSDSGKKSAQEDRVLLQNYLNHHRFSSASEQDARRQIAIIDARIAEIDTFLNPEPEPPTNPKPTAAPAPAPVAAPTLWPGAASTPAETLEGEVSHYELIKQIGKGGMGVTYRAKNLGMIGKKGETVTVKMLDLKEIVATARRNHPGESIEAKKEVIDRILRFHREFQATRILKYDTFTAICKPIDTNIGKVFNISDLERSVSDKVDEGEKALILRTFDLDAEAEKKVFIASEFIARAEGSSEAAPTITEFTRGMVVTKDTLKKLFAPVLAAVAHGHENNVFHRDLKPDNLLVQTNGDQKVRIIDYGIAKISTGDSRTAPDISYGSQCYTAPDIYQGLAKRSVKKSALIDIYEMGIIFYELLTGEHFLGDIKNDPTLWIKFNVNPQGLSEAQLNKIAERDADLRPIIAKMLSPDPKDNYQSMDEVIDALGWGKPFSAPMPTVGAKPAVSALAHTAISGPSAVPAPAPAAKLSAPIVDYLNEITLAAINHNNDHLIDLLDLPNLSNVKLANRKDAMAIVGKIMDLQKEVTDPDVAEVLVIANDYFSRKMIDFSKGGK